jgi:predicted Fe-Mo cluster-binding NifX family protein
MRIAVAAEENKGLDSQVSHHFGRCPYFVMAGVEDGEISQVEVVENPFYQEHRPGEVPAFIRDQAADVMISGGMGRRAIAHFEECDVAAATGACGTVRTTIEQYLSGELHEATPCRESIEHARGQQDHHGE